MKILCTYLFLLTFICIGMFATPLKLTIEEKNFIKDNPIVTIGMMPDFSVFSNIKDSKSIGFEHDLLKIISLKTGLQFDKRLNHWPIIYQAFKHKKTDMVSSITYTDYRSKFTLFTTPYFNMPVMVFVRDDFGKYNGIKSLKDKKIGIIKNIFYEYKMNHTPNLNLIYYTHSKKLVKDLASGKIDALILNVPSVQKIIEDSNYKNIITADELKIENLTKESLQFGIRFEKKLLHSIIQKSLDNISDKEFDELHKKWNLEHYSNPFNYTLIFIIIISLIIVLITTLYLKTKKNNNKLLQLVTTDQLTNIYNRRKIEEILQEEIYRCERFKHSLVLAFLDIDYFKDVNDTYGHQAGDKVLIQIANILKKELRETDFVGRFGGEEFLLIYSESNISDIQLIIEKLRIKIANTNFEQIGKKTASFGITSFKKSDTTETIIKRADDALYQAKNSGRNKIVTKL